MFACRYIPDSAVSNLHWGLDKMDGIPVHNHCSASLGEHLVAGRPVTVFFSPCTSSLQTQGMVGPCPGRPAATQPEGAGGRVCTSSPASTASAECSARLETPQHTFTCVANSFSFPSNCEVWELQALSAERQARPRASLVPPWATELTEGSGSPGRPPGTRACGFYIQYQTKCSVAVG